MRLCQRTADAIKARRNCHGAILRGVKRRKCEHCGRLVCPQCLIVSGRRAVCFACEYKEGKKCA